MDGDEYLGLEQLANICDKAARAGVQLRRSANEHSPAL